MMDFLYFPEDKTEYIPAVITLFIFIIGAVITTYFFYKSSKKEGQRIDEKYNLNHNQEENEGTNSNDDNISE